jgi:hypothetical protein
MGCTGVSNSSSARNEPWVAAMEPFDPRLVWAVHWLKEKRGCRSAERLIPVRYVEKPGHAANRVFGRRLGQSRVTRFTFHHL